MRFEFLVLKYSIRPEFYRSIGVIVKVHVSLDRVIALTN